MLLCPWDSLGDNTGMGCHALLQGIFPTQESNPPERPHSRAKVFIILEPRHAVKGSCHPVVCSHGRQVCSEGGYTRAWVGAHTGVKTKRPSVEGRGDRAPGKRHFEGQYMDIVTAQWGRNWPECGLRYKKG